MFLIVSRYLVPKGYGGLTIFPFIIVGEMKYKNDEVFLTHERIHIRQQLEMLVGLFFIWYLLEYLVRLIQYGDRTRAYRNISFEREAYENEKKPDYLKSRPFWNFLNYL
jgi:hypothetical protein